MTSSIDRRQRVKIMTTLVTVNPEVVPVSGPSFFLTSSGSLPAVLKEVPWLSAAGITPQSRNSGKEGSRNNWKGRSNSWILLSLTKPSPGKLVVGLCLRSFWIQVATYLSS